MTLDECIAEFERIALVAEPLKQTEAYKYNRQLAEWLRELKALKDFANFVAESVMSEDFDENSDFYAEAFCRKLYKMGFVEISDDKWILNNEEINADEKL